ncbi:LD-carboxypeptidase [Mycoplasma sp. NEAQ87857]|uniref:S66 family peptidase n=1 Tax=Mycoplasma sp. NEAQ87857 TaxID=2683967 RepID=UPI001316DABA|nr:S66 peptidase family protein [Mycoplasma sp. NEAQ87857]QGZ97387.1 LD-carboxypeptidase [Mycoplasma sp. NEAQ87857]
MKKLQLNDKLTVVSLSSGALGEPFCAHQYALGIKRIKKLGLRPNFSNSCLKGIDFIKNNPNERAKDLIESFLDTDTKIILSAIGGDDTYKTIGYILDNQNHINAIKNNPKIFLGYSDSSINHLMLNKIGITSYYGLSFLTCIAELDAKMLDYSLKSFNNLFTDKDWIYQPSNVWYEERTNFSPTELNTSRIMHQEQNGWIKIQGDDYLEGYLYGGCIESLYELVSGSRYLEKKQVNLKYQLLDNIALKENKIIFLETSESKSNPDYLKLMLIALKEQGLFNNASGIIIGKPQNEVYFDEYIKIYQEVFCDSNLTIYYNFNFGHSYPKMILPYGNKAFIDIKKQEMIIKNNLK